MVSSVWDVNTFGGNHEPAGSFDIYLSEKKMKEERETKRKDNKGSKKKRDMAAKWNLQTQQTERGGSVKIFPLNLLFHCSHDLC